MDADLEAHPPVLHLTVPPIRTAPGTTASLWPRARVLCLRAHSSRRVRRANESSQALVPRPAFTGTQLREAGGRRALNNDHTPGGQVSPARQFHTERAADIFTIAGPNTWADIDPQLYLVVAVELALYGGGAPVRAVGMFASPSRRPARRVITGGRAPTWW